MKKCLLVSRFNVTNIGDLIIANILYITLNDYFEVDRYNLFGKSNEFVDINKIPSKKMSFLNHFKLELNSYLKRNQLIWLMNYYKKLRKLKKSEEDFEFKNTVIYYDFVIIGGGNMIFEITNSSKTITRFEKYVITAKEYQKPVYVMDIGIGPFKTQEQINHTVKALNKCDYISFRDKASFDIYVTNGGDIRKAFISIDPAFLLENEKMETPRERVIGINVFNSKLNGDTNKQYQEAVKAYAELTDTLIEQLNVNVILFTTEHNDNYTLNDIYKYISNTESVELRFPCGLSNLIDIYKSISLLIGTRMHSMIIAYTQKTPIIGLSWQQKVKSMFKIIDDENSLFNFASFGKEIKNIIRCSNIKLENLETEERKIESKLKDIKKEYGISKNKLVDVINKY